MSLRRKPTLRRFAVLDGVGIALDSGHWRDHLHCWSQYCDYRHQLSLWRICGAGLLGALLARLPRTHGTDGIV